MKTLVYSARPYDTAALQAMAGTNHDFTIIEKRLTGNTATLASGFDAVSLFTSDDASAPVLEILSNAGVRAIALRSAGYDHVDLAKAKTLGIKVPNVPAYSPYAVAEHAVAMLMAVNRKIVESQLLMQIQDFRLDAMVGFDIYNKTVGIIGTGKIGLAFASIMKGFQARVLAFDPIENNDAVELGVEYTSLESLLKTCDIISLHCPLTSKTRHLFSKEQFSIMKKGCVLINTARGSLINTPDLIEALESETLGAACLDVYEFEKGLYFCDHRSDVIHDNYFKELRAFKNVLITGHQGFLTREALHGIAETTVKNLDAWRSNLPCVNALV